jgi:hypothetical protein
MRAAKVDRADYAGKAKDPISAVRRRNFQGTPIDGRYLALGEREVNFRGTSFFFEQNERRRKMKRGLIVLTVSVLSVFTVSALAEMNARQGGGMMGSGWWWGMNSAWFFMIISAILIIFGIFSIMKRD